MKRVHFLVPHKPKSPHILQHHKPLSSASLSTSTNTHESKWNSKTNVLITHPTLVIMESCSSMHQLRQIQARMTLTGLITHTFPLSRVLAFCALADAGDIHYADVIFHHVPHHPNTYMWNTMIRGYRKARIPSTAFSFFIHMLRRRVPFDPRTFVFSLKACELFSDASPGDSVHCVVRKMGFDSEMLVRNALVHFYADRGLLRHAHEVFDESSDRDVIAWTTMIGGYAAMNCADAALGLFGLMLDSDVEPNEVTLIAVLSACAQKGDIGMGKNIHENVEKKETMCCLSLHNALLDMYVKCGSLKDARELFDRMETRDVFSWTSMVNGYAKCGDLESARRFFDRTPQKNAVCWSAMIAGYSQNNQPKESLKLFHEMVDTGVVPMEHTLVSVLSACGQLSCLKTGHWIHQYFVNGKRMPLSITLANAIIDMYAKCGSIDAAAEVFGRMLQKNLVSWNSMVSGYAANGQAKRAIDTFDQMICMGFEPDDITFVSLLTACSHGGLISEGQEYFDAMERKYGIKPKKEHYACMIDLLGRTGLLEEAYKLIMNMPMQPSEAAWGALLNACRMHGNVELARVCVHNLLTLDPEDSGIYVLLANICASDRKWGDVKRVRSLMRDKGVKKIPGHSLIEIDGEFIEFLVADESHPRFNEIHKMLDEIFFMSKLEDCDFELQSSLAVLL